MVHCAIRSRISRNRAQWCGTWRTTSRIPSPPGFPRVPSASRRPPACDRRQSRTSLRPGFARAYRSCYTGCVEIAGRFSGHKQYFTAREAAPTTPLTEPAMATTLDFGHDAQGHRQRFAPLRPAQPSRACWPRDGAKKLTQLEPAAARLPAPRAQRVQRKSIERARRTRQLIRGSKSPRKRKNSPLPAARSSDR